MRAKASSLLIATAFLLSAESLFLACGRKHQSGQTTIPASAEPQKAWRWVDPNLKVRSRADLDEILKQHRFWLEFTRSEDFRESGEDRGDPPAELGEAILNGAELSRAILDEAQLNDAFLKGANLARANLDGADLTHAYLTSANLDHAYLEGADLSRAYLGDADLSSANLSGAHLNDAWLRNDPFDASSKAPNLSNANLTGADLARADLSDAHLEGADLARADLSDAHLEGADLGHAELGGVVFRPAELPMLSPLAAANGLESMAYKHDPGQLTQLRKRFQDAGYREQERAITCALNRHNAIPSELHESLKQKSKSLRGEKFDPNKIMSFKSFIEGRFKWVAFDLTCEYGFSYGRPLRIVGLLWLLFSITYVVFMHRPGTSGIPRRYTMVAWPAEHPGDANLSACHWCREMVEAAVPLAAAGVAGAARRHVLQPDVSFQHRLSRHQLWPLAAAADQA